MFGVNRPSTPDIVNDLEVPKDLASALRKSWAACMHDTNDINTTTDKINKEKEIATTLNNNENNYHSGEEEEEEKGEKEEEKEEKRERKEKENINISSTDYKNNAASISNTAINSNSIGSMNKMNSFYLDRRNSNFNVYYDTPVSTKNIKRPSIISINSNGTNTSASSDGNNTAMNNKQQQDLLSLLERFNFNGGNSITNNDSATNNTLNNNNINSTMSNNKNTHIYTKNSDNLESNSKQPCNFVLNDENELLLMKQIMNPRSSFSSISTNEHTMNPTINNFTENTTITANNVPVLLKNKQYRQGHNETDVGNDIIMQDEAENYTIDDKNANNLFFMSSIWVVKFSPELVNNIISISEMLYPKNLLCVFTDQDIITDDILKKTAMIPNMRFQLISATPIVIKKNEPKDNVYFNRYDLHMLYSFYLYNYDLVYYINTNGNHDLSNIQRLFEYCQAGGGKVEDNNKSNAINIGGRIDNENCIIEYYSTDGGDGIMVVRPNKDIVACINEYLTCYGDDYHKFDQLKNIGGWDILQNLFKYQIFEKKI
ncbi:Ids2p SCDLUD_002606 [Saccharomycodes ludwigii]|uniref:Ids2p n=1 Tax=Saccharomycodes ludwigii TaxID=36035 RepID=UPI001E83B9E5|nr:hypothetical protein SCDLUD_002606 [Saccharomycodes ludwigii]KAH3901124.1 hypothetical protein SCDLUD_002606 [Saccharomycodes ludwigii]